MSEPTCFLDKNSKHAEHILSFSREDLTGVIESLGLYPLSDTKQYLFGIDAEGVNNIVDLGNRMQLKSMSLKHRAPLESSFADLQPLKYFVVENAEGDICSYQRLKYEGAEARLTGMHSIGFGGHVVGRDLRYFEDTDVIDVGATFGANAVREASGEFTIIDGDGKPCRTLTPEDFKVVGVIMQFDGDIKTAGNFHFGILLKIKLLPGETLVDAIDADIDEARIVGFHSPLVASMEDTLVPFEKYEPWSQIALNGWVELHQNLDQ